MYYTLIEKKIPALKHKHTIYNISFLKLSVQFNMKTFQPVIRMMLNRPDGILNKNQVDHKRNAWYLHALAKYV